MNKILENKLRNLIRNEIKTVLNEMGPAQDLSYFNKAEKVIKLWWKKTENIGDDENLAAWFDSVEREFDNYVVDVVDQMWSADKMHYNQRSFTPAMIKFIKNPKKLLDTI